MIETNTMLPPQSMFPSNPSIAFVFPGQGSQSVGMGFSLIKNFPDFEAVFLETLREADAVLGFSLSRLLKEGPEAELKLTQNTQPALLTVSTAFGRYLKRHGHTCQIALGHSLGEYSALVFAESLLFSDAIQLVRKRGLWMSEAVAPGQAGMAALVGATAASAAQLCESLSTAQDPLEISLFNSPQQFVVSGSRQALSLAQERAKDFGIRKVVRLDVSGPFHSSLLRPAAEKMKAELASVQVEAPRIDVIANVTGQRVHEPAEIRHLLAQQVCRPVLWEASIRQASALGIRSFLEVGSSQVLTGLIQKIEPEACALSAETLTPQELRDAFAVINS